MLAPCQRSQQLCVHLVSIVKEYADKVSALSTTTLTRVSIVNVVNNYADVDSLTPCPRG